MSRRGARFQLLLFIGLPLIVFFMGFLGVLLLSR